MEEIPRLLKNHSYLEAGNYSNRDGKAIDGIVLHYTGGGSGRKTAHWAREPIGRSWHFLGCRDGKFIQQVPLTMAAWHAGRSEWLHSNGEMYSGANRYTIGIELANHGCLEKVGGQFYYEVSGNMFRYHRAPPVQAQLRFDNGNGLGGWWEPYSEEQLLGLDKLLDSLENIGIPRRLVGHEEIAMPFGLRKFDPGPLFPWGRYGRENGRRTTAVVYSGG
jgi:N-acetylmuramoyl-L-alanine amidase